MKDIVITSLRLKKEAVWLLGCFILSVCVNTGAIIAYDRPWSELYMMIGYEIVLALAFYLVSAVIRLLVAGIVRIIKR